jgi:hypothetical protein
MPGLNAGGALSDEVGAAFIPMAIGAWEEIMTAGASNPGQEAMLDSIIPTGSDYIESSWEEFDGGELYDEATGSIDGAEQALGETISAACSAVSDIKEASNAAADVTGAFL